MPEKHIVKKKICLLGDPAVGKTSLIQRFVLDKYDDNYLSTLGTKVTKKEIDIIDEASKAEFNLTFMIWDVLGQKEFRRIHESAFQGTKGAFVVCDISRPETIKSLDEWASKLIAVTGKVPLIFLCNKADLIQNPDLSFVEELSMKYLAPRYLTSAKTGINVNEAFISLGKFVIMEQM